MIQWNKTSEENGEIKINAHKEQFQTSSRLWMFVLAGWIFYWICDPQNLLIGFLC